MAIQITQDPINNFMDNLPRYVLDLRRIEQQNEQFNKELDFRMEVDKRKAIAFDEKMKQNQYQSDLIKSMIDAQYKNNQVKRDVEAWQKSNSKIRDEWENYDESLIGNFRQTVGTGPKNLLEFMEMKSKPEMRVNRFGEKYITKQADVTQEQIDNYKQIIDRATVYVEPEKVEIPEGLIMNENLLNWANQAEKDRVGNMNYVNDWLRVQGVITSGITDPLNLVGTER